MKFEEIEGDLVALAKEGKFDIIGHGVNCFCIMGAGLAVPMAKEFNCDKFPLENNKYKGDINKLGQIDYQNAYVYTENGISDIFQVINCYTQYYYGNKFGIPVDYEAITLCMRKINKLFKGKHIGLPRIGCGLAGGDWNIVKPILQKELKDMDVTIVYK